MSQEARLQRFLNCTAITPPSVAKRHVDPEEFFSLALSNRKLFRADQGAQGLRGLLDPETGDCFVVEEERLMACGRSTD